MTKKMLTRVLALGLVALVEVSCTKKADSQSGQGSKSQALASASAASAPASVSVTAAVVPLPDGGTASGMLEGYALGAPDEELELPRELAEISAVTAISDSEVACVQDEVGIVFLYDLGKKEITRRIPFAPPGDYEGLARLGKNLYVLRSDGTIFQLEDFAASKPKVDSTTLRMPTPDNEGLCYDPVGARLLISPKSRPGNTDEEKRTQVLFKYDPANHQLDSEPVVTFDLDDVFDGTRKDKKEKKGKKGKKKVVASRFLPSDVAVHPKTGHYFLLSSVGNNLAVFDRQGNLKSQYPLNSVLFPQPEGLTFLPNGELVITSEGAGKMGKLLRFKSKL